MGARGHGGQRVLWTVTDLPFDLRHRLVKTYSNAEDAAERAPARKQIAGMLAGAVREIVTKDRAGQLPPAVRALRSREIRDATRDRVVKPLRTVAGLKRALKQPVDPDSDGEAVKDVMKIARRLALLPPNAARLLDVINARTTHKRWYRRALLAASRGRRRRPRQSSIASSRC
jgi:hypothetical protein